MLLISQLYVFCIAQINVLLRRFAVGDEGGQVLEVAERDNCFLADLGRIDHAVDVIRAVNNGTLDLGFEGRWCWVMPAVSDTPVAPMNALLIRMVDSASIADRRQTNP